MQLLYLSANLQQFAFTYLELLLRTMTAHLPVCHLRTLLTAILTVLALVATAPKTTPPPEVVPPSATPDLHRAEIASSPTQKEYQRES